MSQRKRKAGLCLIVTLCLSVAVRARQPRSPSRDLGVRTYNIRDCAAVGDGRTLDSPAINRAIEACAQAGGGTVSVPAGTHLSGSIHLKSNIHLYLDAGAVIPGVPQGMNDCDPVEPFEGNAHQDGGHFAIILTGCDGLMIDKVTIDTNRDGIDLDCCRNTTVSNCRINAPGVTNMYIVFVNTARER